MVRMGLYIIVCPRASSPLGHLHGHPSFEFSLAELLFSQGRDTLEAALVLGLHT